MGRTDRSGSEHAAQRNYSIAVDFDGVIHSYTSKWVSADVIPDPPVRGAIEWLTEMDKRFRVVIFTTRGKTHDGRLAVRDWLVEHGFYGAGRVGPTSNPQVDDYEVEITATKPPALIYLDDRAVRFDGENFPTADEIHREFVPWNKRRP